MTIIPDKLDDRISPAGYSIWLLVAPQLRNLLFLLFTVTTLLFFLLRAAGDPAYLLAGIGATPEQLAIIRSQYGLDRPLAVQYLAYLWNILHLDFGRSLASGEPALQKVLERFPRTLQLAVSAIVLSMALAVPVGGWLGFRPNGPMQRLVAGIVFIFQGIPGFVMALLLVQLLAVNLRWVPSMGYSTTDWRTWILPTLSLAAFLTPGLIRVIAANIAEITGEDYIRTAKANGASPRQILWRHAMPNALLGATALLGTQFAHLLGGSAIIETIFSWPGMGWLLLESVQTLDFPVVQCEAFVIAILVFAINLLTDLCFRLLDPPFADAADMKMGGRVNLELASGGFLFCLLLLAAIFSPWLQAADPLQGNLMARFAPVGQKGFLLGSDQLGRDLWSRAVAGLQWSMACALTADILNLVIGVALGLLAAERPGLTRTFIRQLTDTFQSFPSLVVAIVVVVVIGHGFLPLVLTLGFLSWPIFMRVAFAEASSIIQRDYVKAAKVAGVSRWAILTGHVLPGLRASLLAIFALNFSGLLIAESALSFLGIGAPLGVPTWGNMLAESRQYMLRAPWLMLVPAGAIILAVITANLLGDGIGGLSARRGRNANE